VGRWKTQSALPHPTFLLLSVSCRVLLGRVFIFGNSRLEDVAIKLVEFAFGKTQISQPFLLKRGNFILKKH
jgi:hypothetical protein